MARVRASRVSKALTLVKSGRVNYVRNGGAFVVEGDSGRYFTSVIDLEEAKANKVPWWLCSCPWGVERSGDAENPCSHALAVATLRSTH